MMDAERSEVVERLREAGVPSPDVDARWLMAESEDAQALEEMVQRRIRREPLQLILGHTAFRELGLRCRRGVFIPRPETEIVAGLAIDAAAAAWPDPVVLEPCTGTGAIALSVAAEVPGVHVVAGDVSDEALSLARENLARLETGQAGPPGLADGARCQFVRSDLLGGFQPDLRGVVDVLVANPPYLPAGDRSGWDPEVADHDPETALVGGEDGMEVVFRLLEHAPRWLAPGGTVVVEIDERRGEDALAAARAAGLTGARLARDLTGVDRAVVAEREVDRV